MRPAAIVFLALCGILAPVIGCGSSTSGSGSAAAPTLVTFTIGGFAPTTVAVKIGSGAFTAATLTAGTLTISLPNGESSFAVAYTCSDSVPPSGNFPSVFYEEDVYEQTTLDGNSFKVSCLGPTPILFSPGTLTGSLDATAIPGVSSLSAYAGNGSVATEFDSISSSHSFSFAAPAGSDRVLLLAYQRSAGVANLVARKNFDSQPVPGVWNGGNAVVLSATDETTSFPITYGPLAAGFALQGTSASLNIGSTGLTILTDPATSQYSALPAGALRTGDFYSISTVASNGTEVTSVTNTSTSAIPANFVFPPNWSYSGPTPAAVPTFNQAYTGFAGSTGVSYRDSWNWGNGGYLIAINATANYLNGATSLSLPDLSAVAGFVTAPASGTNVYWTAAITQTAYTAQPSSSANASVTSVTNNGQYKVP